MVQKRQRIEDEYNLSSKQLKLENSWDFDLYFQFTNPRRLSMPSSANSTTSEQDASSAVLIHTPDAYSYLLEHSPRKQVPIGPEYQANMTECSGHDKDETKFIGSCVIPMPEDPTIRDNNTVGKGLTNCFCKNRGSHGCIQQHIKEAREILKESIGHKKFSDLGFDDMGEVVSENWTQDDDQLFHEIVYSNPVSSCRNFWKLLSLEFPSRSYREIVSYYFNVVVLRRRAEQNRCNPMNIDSDDDEWEGSDTSANDENRKLLHYSCSFDSVSQLSDGDHDFQNKSEVDIDSSESWVNREFIFDPLDCRVWDVGYFSCMKTKTDFLPTGSMIEEVFGIESWNFESLEDEKSSN